MEKNVASTKKRQKCSSERKFQVQTTVLEQHLQTISMGLTVIYITKW